MSAPVIITSPAAYLRQAGAKPHYHPRPRLMRWDAHFKSPGRSSAIFRRLPFARCQAFGGAASAEVLTPFAVNLFGALKALRSLSVFRHALQPAKQALGGFTNRFRFLSCVLRHGTHHVERNVGNAGIQVGKHRNV